MWAQEYCELAITADIWFLEAAMKKHSATC